MPDPNWSTQKALPASRMSKRRVQIVGHRGAAGLAPENTLSAFQKALDLGVDGVEFDVQRTADGELVLFHDEDVQRSTDGTGLLRKLTLSELQALDAGTWFAPDYRHERVPTLRQLFDFMRGNNLLLFIELKDPFHYPGMEQQVADLIREYDFVDRCQVHSFHHAALHTFYKLAPEIAVSELWFDRLPSQDEVFFKTIDALYTLYTPQNLAQLHQRGQRATAWTVNDVEQAQRLINWGIDSLTTDYPDRLLTLFDSP